ncbi:FkbM family methyltransferase [Coralliovum pocilloporae]|uniref:FkbM family methyltransferase n=1 Tax=Coralliovum pocilloporae TaxID=3066369 RepID=UPI003307499B
MRKTPIVCRRRGCLLLLNPKDWIDNRLLSGIDFENRQIERCAELIKENNLNCFLDIGANIGLYSVLLPTLTDIDAVHSFEPVKSTFIRLNTNLLLNGLENRVQCHNIALGEMNETAQIHIDRNSTGVSAIDPELCARSRQYSNIETIEIARLDDFLPMKGERILAKIDVEGYTLNTLLGMKAFLQNNEMVLQIEMGNKNDDEVKSFLNDSGYRLLNYIEGDAYFSNIGG